MAGFLKCILTLLAALIFSGLFSDPGFAVDTDIRMAQVVRRAVQSADSGLLRSEQLESWREYLKIAAMQLSTELQPLLLIKFDEDVHFRQSLKELIQRQRSWQSRESENFIYYFREIAPPEIALPVQDAHINELQVTFGVELSEKIPYLFDAGFKSDTVVVLDQLEGCIRSAYPIDLESSTFAFISGINPGALAFCQALSLIYGRFYQNTATARAFYEQSLTEIRKASYVPVSKSMASRILSEPGSLEFHSAYVFVSELIEEFGPAKIASFLDRLPPDYEGHDFKVLFKEQYGVGLTAFENRFLVD